MATSWDRILAATAARESNGNYGRVVLNDAGAGLSYGLIQFNQYAGTLGPLLQAMARADAATFNACFGDYAGQLSDPSWVGNRGNSMGVPAVVTGLQDAAAVATFQGVQRDCAKSFYFTPIEPTVKALGLTSERAYAMAFDTAVQRGPGTAKTLLHNAVNEVGPGSGPEWELNVLTRFAPAADSTPNGRFTRRQDLLTDEGLSDAAYAAGIGLGTLVCLALTFFYFYNRA